MVEQNLDAFFSGKGDLSAYLKDNIVGVLSLVRFAAEHDRAITREMYHTIEHARGTRVQSYPLVGEELERILMSNASYALRMMLEMNVLHLFLPEVAACFGVPQKNPNHIYSVGEHMLRVVDGVARDRNLRWAALLHDTGKTRTHTTDMFGIDHFHGHEAVSRRIAETVLKRLHIKDIETILTLIEYHDMAFREEDVAPFMKRYGAQVFFMLLDLKEADTGAKSKELYEERHRELLNLRKIAEREEKRNQI